MGREREVVKKQLETDQVTAAKNILGCSSTTSNTVCTAAVVSSGILPHIEGFDTFSQGVQLPLLAFLVRC